MNLTMELGEVRHVKLKVKSVKQEEFVISNADFELKKCDLPEPEDAGNANIIDDRTLDVVISPQNIGEYDLKYTYHIADETLIDIVRVKVLG